MGNNKEAKDNAPYCEFLGNAQPMNYPQNFNYARPELYPPYKVKYQDDRKVRKD